MRKITDEKTRMSIYDGYIALDDEFQAIEKSLNVAYDVIEKNASEELDDLHEKILEVEEDSEEAKDMRMEYFKVEQEYNEELAEVRRGLKDLQDILNIFQNILA